MRRIALVCAIAVGMYGGGEGWGSVGSPRGVSHTALPQTATIVGTLRLPVADGILFEASGPTLYVVASSKQRPSVITVERVSASGSVTKEPGGIKLSKFLSSIAIGREGLYVATSLPARFFDQPDEVVRINPGTLHIVKRAFFSGPLALAADGRWLLASTGDGRVLRLDPRTLRLQASKLVLTNGGKPPDYATLSRPAVGLGSVWVVALHDRSQRELVRMDPSTLAIRSRTQIPTSGRLSEALRSVVGSTSHVYLVGDGVAEVNEGGHFVRSAVSVPGLEAAAIYGNHLIGVIEAQSASLVSISAAGQILARTSTHHAGAPIIVGGHEVWLLGDIGQGNGIVHLRLINP